ncbi:MAG: biotin/lipoyl-containing protein, partial [Halioglobus sp.]|nr:biotin/lipoyl-containing protein [Halioglobus sp.]
IPLVTPTSQIVGTQSVINVLTGERYKSISKETAGVLKGEYGATPAPVNAQLQQRVLEGAQPITCRPADVLAPELDGLSKELHELAADKGIRLASGQDEIDDVLTYALFPQIGLRFLENRGDASAFEPPPSAEEPAAPAAPAAAPSGGPEVYTVSVDGKAYVVEVAPGGDVSGIAPAPAAPAAATSAAATGGQDLAAPLAGNIFKLHVSEGERVEAGDLVLILEAMKMETEVRATTGGVVTSVNVKVGDSVAVGEALITVA